MERLLRDVQHHGGVLADAEEHHRLLTLGDDLADDVDGLGFEALEVTQAHGSERTVSRSEPDAGGAQAGAGGARRAAPGGR